MGFDACATVPSIGLGSAALVAIYDYLGYYDICYIGDEVREPARVIPRSILFSIRAYNSQAKGGERLILGGQDATGRIRQDRGRINALRIRPGRTSMVSTTWC